MGDYTLTYLGSEQQRAANAQELRARLAVARGDKDLGTVVAGKNRSRVRSTSGLISPLLARFVSLPRRGIALRFAALVTCH